MKDWKKVYHREYRERYFISKSYRNICGKIQIGYDVTGMLLYNRYSQGLRIFLVLEIRLPLPHTSITYNQFSYRRIKGEALQLLNSASFRKNIFAFMS